MNGSTALGSAVSCTPAAATASAGASCTATLSTALSLMTPTPTPNRLPRVPSAPLWIAAWVLFAAFLVCVKYLPKASRRGYVYAGLLLLAAMAAGFAGCKGVTSSSSGSGSGSGQAHTDKISAVYSGDSNYAGSTSTATTVTVQ